MNFVKFFRRTSLKRTSANGCSDIGMLFADFWRARISLWLSCLHPISPNYTKKENFQSRFSCLIIFTTQANISDMH